MYRSDVGAWLSPRKLSNNISSQLHDLSHRKKDYIRGHLGFVNFMKDQETNSRWNVSTQQVGSVGFSKKSSCLS